jgi:hydrogenase maturation protein HypF
MATTINFDLMIRGIIEDLKQNLENTLIATKFHNTIIKAAWQGAEILRKKHSINKVVLSGGVFQNKYILEGLTGLLEKNKFEVFSHVAIPANDGGIALGQLAIASKRRELKCV